MFSFFHFITGFYRLSISGSGKERFLNLCTNQNILIWNLQRKEDQYEFYTSSRALSKMKEYAEKTSITLTIKGEHGLPFFLYHYKKRQFFLFGIPVCLLLIYILSLFIWDIKIIGTEQYTVNEIEKYLNEHEIVIGIWKKEVSCNDLEEQIRADFEDAAWVSCDIEGTCLSVHLKESIHQAELEDRTVPNDIVASKDGTIVSIITRNGTPLVKENDKVKKGDTLISGIIYLYNEYDELLETNEICADGDIFAETAAYYDESFPLTSYEKEYTGRTIKQYSFFAGKYGISLPTGKNPFKQYDEFTETSTLRIGKSLYLPFSLEIVTKKEYQSKKIILTEEQARTKGAQKIEHYLNSLKKEGKEIISNRIGIEIKDGICHLSGTVKVLESISKIRNIP